MLANGSMWAHCVRSPNTYRGREREGGSLTLAHVVGVNYFVNIRSIYIIIPCSKEGKTNIKVLLTCSFYKACSHCPLNEANLRET